MAMTFGQIARREAFNVLDKYMSSMSYQAFNAHE